jgi:hypothetical protein
MILVWDPGAVPVILLIPLTGTQELEPADLQIRHKEHN